MEEFSFYEQLEIDDEYMRTYNIEETIFENMLIMNNCLKPMLMLDREGKGLEWMKTFVKDVKIVKEDDQHDIMAIVGECITSNTHLMVEINKFLSPELASIIKKMDTETSIKIGDKEMIFSPEFKLYLVMKSPLNITQDILNKLTVVNFAPGIERIERDVRFEMTEKISPGFLARYGDLTKRKISIRSELTNQKKSLIEMFYKHTELSENLINEMESPTSAILELKKMLLDDEKTLQAMTLPPLSVLVTKAALCLYHVLQAFHSFTSSEYDVSDYLKVLKKGITEGHIED